MEDRRGAVLSRRGQSPPGSSGATPTRHLPAFHRFMLNQQPRVCLFWFEEGNGVFSVFYSPLRQLQEAERAEQRGGREEGRKEEITSSHRPPLPMHTHAQVSEVSLRGFYVLRLPS